MNETIKKLCEVIGKDLSKLHKGDTASALWPFIPNEAEYYTGEFFMNELYFSIKRLKREHYSNEQIAKLFGHPSKIAQYFTLFHSAEVLEPNQRQELALDLINFLFYYREDAFCDTNNRLKQYSFEIEKLSADKRNKMLSNKLSALLLLYLEILYPTMMRLGHEFHGIYKKNTKKIFIKEFFNLNPLSLNLTDKFPFKKIRIIEEIKGDLDLDFFNHLFQSPKKIASYVEIDDRLIQNVELEEVYRTIEKKVKEVISKIKNFSRKDWFKVYTRGLFYSIKKIRNESGIYKRVPKSLFEKIDKEDFKLPLEKIIEFNKKHSEKEIENITKKSFLKIFENKKAMKEVEIHLTTQCPHNCLFCSVKKHPEVDLSFKEIKRDIKLSSDFDKLILSGGEPLLRKDIIKIIRFAKKYQNNLSMETNLVLSNKDLIEEMIKSGLNELKVSFHSEEESSYERITKSKDIKKLIKNLGLLRKYHKEIKVTTNTVVTKYNYKNLDRIVKYIEDNFPFISEIRISYPRFYPLKGYKDYSKRYLIPLKKLKSALNRISSEKVIFENIPLCILNDEKAKKINWNTKLIKNGKIIQGLEGRYYPSKCDKCKIINECQGLHKFYFLYFNENFVKPFK